MRVICLCVLWVFCVASYNAYAMRIGFRIRKSHNRLSNDKSLIAIDYICSRERFRDRKCQKKNYTNSEPTETRIGCKALMGLKKVELRWIVHRLVIKYNYDLLSPKSTSLLRGVQLVQTHDIIIIFFMSQDPVCLSTTIAVGAECRQHQHL
jgi:hypothetical protein